jgi:glycosyltransferase involved in cell wall biosynthesis
MATAERPRLLIAVTQYPDGGGISAIVENSVQLLEGDFEVHVAIVDEQPGRRERLALDDSRVHVPARRRRPLPLVFPTSLTFTVRTAAFLRRLVRRLRPDALLVQDGMFLPVPGLLATAASPAKLVVMDHGTLTNILDRDWQRLIIGRMPLSRRVVFATAFALDTPWRSLRWRIGLRRADGAWYVGEENAPYFRQAGPRARRYGQIVPTDFRPAVDTERQDARERLGVPQSATLVNMVTRLDGEKGLYGVLRALAAARAVCPDLKLLIAGGGTLEQDLVDEAGRLGVGDAVDFLGRLNREEVRTLHHASDFHLYAGTIGCGMSVALLEAMACGVIPVVSDVPNEQRALVADAGWVFPAGDDQAMERALVEAVGASDTEREQLRERSLERVHAYGRPSLRDLIGELLPA